MAVYFVEPELVAMRKIGCTKSVDSRLSMLLGTSPVKLRIAAVDHRADFLTEAQLLWRFRAQRSHSEWFRVSADLLALIEAVAATGSIPGAWYLPSNYTSDYARPGGDWPAYYTKRFGIRRRVLMDVLGVTQINSRVPIRGIPAIYEYLRAEGHDITPHDLLDRKALQKELAA